GVDRVAALGVRSPGGGTGVIGRIAAGRPGPGLRGRVRLADLTGVGVDRAAVLDDGRFPGRLVADVRTVPVALRGLCHFDSRSSASSTTSASTTSSWPPDDAPSAPPAAPASEACAS